MATLRIVIVSHKRSGTWTTLGWLRNFVGYRGAVDVWLSLPEDVPLYKAACDSAVSLRVAERPHLFEKLNEISMFYEVGERVVVVEDDVEGYMAKSGKTRLHPADNRFMSEVDEAFVWCQTNRANLWGISPHANAFYMQDGLSSGLKFCVAYLFGIVITRDKSLLVSSDFKHDYERSVLYYARDRAVIRRNDRCVVTARAASECGGLNSDYGSARLSEEKKALSVLERKLWPLAKIKADKKTGIGSLRLHDPFAGKGVNWMARLQERWVKEAASCRG